MIIIDMKNKANIVKDKAKKRIAEYEKECIEKEVKSVFDWILKVIEDKIKETIEYNFVTKEYIFKQSFFIQENNTIVVKCSGNNYIMEELGIYNAKEVKGGSFKEVIKKVLDIFEKIDGYSVWYDFSKNSFSVSLIIEKVAEFYAK